MGTPPVKKKKVALVLWRDLQTHNRNLVCVDTNIEMARIVRYDEKAKGNTYVYE
jgi:hypothetical protein